MNQKTIVFIVGPTGVGKSQVAMELALALPAEIVSCDAMQVYRELSIASDKPSAQDRAKVLHHMIDCVGVNEDFDVVRYRNEALAAIEGIHARNKIPLIVGGSGMYVAVLLDGIFEGVSEDAAIRRQLMDDVKVQGIEKLYQRLQKVDPQAALRINPNDQRRVVRALEVYLTMKKPISVLQKDRHGLWGKYNIKIFGLNRDREQLYGRVNARVDGMFQRGLVDEIKSLEGLTLGRNVRTLIGIPEIQTYLSGGCSLLEASEKIKMNTRRYVKRQLTWFRKDKRLDWFMVRPEQSASDVSALLLDKLL